MRSAKSRTNSRGVPPSGNAATTDRCSKSGQSMLGARELVNVMRCVIFLGLTFICAVLFAGTVFSFFDLPGWVIFPCFAVGGYLGISVAWLFYKHFVRRPTAQRTRPLASHNQPPTPFANRLRQFTGNDTIDRSDEFVSTMPFWLRPGVYSWTPPKPIEITRRILVRIRDLVRGDS